MFDPNSFPYGPLGIRMKSQVSCSAMNSEIKNRATLSSLGVPARGGLTSNWPIKVFGDDHDETGDEANELAGMGGNSVEPRQRGELVESDLLCSNILFLSCFFPRFNPVSLSKVYTSEAKVFVCKWWLSLPLQRFCPDCGWIRPLSLVWRSCKLTRCTCYLCALVVQNCKMSKNHVTLLVAWMGTDALKFPKVSFCQGTAG